jgi:hypothetical protein
MQQKGRAGNQRQPLTLPGLLFPTKANSDAVLISVRENTEKKSGIICGKVEDLDT